MSTDNSNGQPVNTGIPKASGMAFVTHFVPGLVIGLLVGALATAFITPLLERDNIKLPPGVPASAASTPGANQSAEDQPVAPAPTDPATTPADPQSKPAEVKPAEGEKPADAPKPAP